MTTLLVNQLDYNIKQARVIAKSKGYGLKCKIMIHQNEHYYCFGVTPIENIAYNIHFEDDGKIIFLSL